MERTRDFELLVSCSYSVSDMMDDDLLLKLHLVKAGDIKILAFTSDFRRTTDMGQISICLVASITLLQS